MPTLHPVHSRACHPPHTVYRVRHVSASDCRLHSSIGMLFTGSVDLHDTRDPSRTRTTRTKMHTVCDAKVGLEHSHSTLESPTLFDLLRKLSTLEN